MANLSYLMLNLLVLAVEVAILWPQIRSLNARATWLSLAVLVGLTAVFDNLIVGSGIVAYHRAAILGIFTPIAPIEDYFYAVAAALGAPAIWVLMGKVWPDASTDDGAEK